MSARRGSTACRSHKQEAEHPLKREVAAGPLFIWASIQVGAIALTAWRVPLAAQYPTVAEFYACRVLAAVQLPIAILLTPVLTKDLQTCLAAAALAAMLQVAASLLTAVPPTANLPLSFYVASWIVATFSLRACFSSKSLFCFGGGVATFVAGTPFLIYLGTDISSRQLQKNIPGALLPSLNDWPSVTWAAWIWMFLIFGVTCGIGLIFQVNSTQSRSSVSSSEA